jgi:hypothetical protein
MKLYLVHCGFNDMGLFHGAYEAHADLFVVANTFEEARKNVKEVPEFKARKMHIDSLQEIVMIHGYSVQLCKKESDQTVIISHRHAETASQESISY